jgi:transposase-like protein
MRYSQGFKESILKKVLPPESRSVAEVSRETGVAVWSIYQWKRDAREGRLEAAGGELRPKDRNPGEKLRLVIEGNGPLSQDRCRAI